MLPSLDLSIPSDRGNHPGRRRLVLAAILAALVVPCLILDTCALPFHELFVEKSRSQGWLKEVINPLRGMGGPAAPFLALTLMVILDPPRRRRVFFAILAFGAAVLAVQVTKALTGRARPEMAAGILSFKGPGIGGIFNDDYGSFPSGHTASAFTLAAVLAINYPRSRWFFSILAAGCGFARVAEGRHFPTDVYVGALIGIASAGFFMTLETRTCRPPPTGS